MAVRAPILQVTSAGYFLLPPLTADGVLESALCRGRSAVDWTAQRQPEASCPGICVFESA